MKLFAPPPRRISINFYPANKAILSVLLLTISLSILSQSPQTFCETDPPSSIQLCDPLNGDAQGPYYVRVYIHVIRDGSGNGGLNDGEVQIAMQHLHDDFLGHNIYFVRGNGCKIDYINDDGFYNLTKDPSLVFNENNNDDGIDIYLFPDGTEIPSTGGGLAQGFLPSTAFFVKGTYWKGDFNDYFNSSVMSHEMGHCLGLYHTHQGMPACETCAGCIEEVVDDPDCDEVGDLICATPADPCINHDVNLTTCQWNESGTDENGNPYDPDESNIMAYTPPQCMSGFVDEQGQRMRNCLEYNSSLSDVQFDFEYSDITIDVNTNWNNNTGNPERTITINGNLTISTGISLSIDSDVTVRFTRNSSLVIEQGAILNLDGTLTSFCSDYWQGVKVWGASSSSQLPSSGVHNQGRLKCNAGSVIENALIGAQLYGPDRTLNAGGQLDCDGAIFRNNATGVDIVPYNNYNPHTGQPLDYRASFLESRFETTELYPLYDVPFGQFISLAGVNGISIKGCSFECHSSQAKGSYGIASSNSGFKINDGINDSEFRGLHIAIYAENSFTTSPKTFDVRNSDFIDCNIGIYCSKTSACTIAFNEFELGNPATPDLGNLNAQIGIILYEDFNGITCELNNFKKVPGPNDATIGIVCASMGAFSNRIRLNTYDGLKICNQAQANNRSNQFPNRGLQYECNINLNTTDYDFIVLNHIQLQQLGRIKENQRILDPLTNEFGPVGNTFSYTGLPIDSDFSNNDSNFDIISYTYEDGANNQEPLDYSGLEKVFETKVNNCEATVCTTILCEADPDEFIDIFIESRTRYESQYQLYQTVLSQNDSLLIADALDSMEIYQQRMDASSHQVIKHILYDTTTFDIDTLRKWLNHLDTYSSQLMVAGTYLGENELTSAIKILDSIPLKYQLDSNEIIELDSIKVIYSMLDTTDIYNLSESSLARLHFMADSMTSLAASSARGVLAYLGYYYTPKIMLPYSNQGSELTTKNYDAFTADKKYINIYPNPVNNIVVFELDQVKLNDVELSVFDSMGRLVKSFKLGNSNKAVWSPENQGAGIYFYKLIDNKKIIDNGKFVIQK